MPHSVRKEEGKGFLGEEENESKGLVWFGFLTQMIKEEKK